MKANNILKGIAMGAVVITIAACSSTKGKSGGVGGAGGYGANGYGAGQDGAYAQGYEGGSGGYYNDANCSAPQGAQSYYFDFDSNALHPEDRGRIQALAQNASSSHENLRVVGNTDNRGSREYNVALGWRRADAVASTLEQYGVSRQQVSTTSNGAEKPVAYGDSEQDYQCNRRVDVKSGG